MSLDGFKPSPKLLVEIDSRLIIMGKMLRQLAMIEPDFNPETSFQEFTDHKAIRFAAKIYDRPTLAEKLDLLDEGIFRKFYDAIYVDENGSKIKRETESNE